MALPIHVAAVQYASDLESNTVSQDSALHLMDDAAHVADLVVLPEASFSSYHPGRDARQFAEPIGGPTATIVAQIAVTRNAHICYCIVERDGDRFFNTAVLMGADGNIAGRHRKINLSPDEIDAGFFRGEEPEAFSTHLGRIGILIAEDAYDIANARALDIKGAQVVLIPCMALAAIPESADSDIARWEKLLRGNAVAGRCYVACASKIGMQAGIPFIGNSMIISPRGDIISRGSFDQEQVVRAKIVLPPKGPRSEFRPLAARRT